MPSTRSPRRSAFAALTRCTMQIALPPMCNPLRPPSKTTQSRSSPSMLSGESVAPVITVQPQERSIPATEKRQTGGEAPEILRPSLPQPRLEQLPASTNVNIISGPVQPAPEIAVSHIKMPEAAPAQMIIPLASHSSSPPIQANQSNSSSSSSSPTRHLAPHPHYHSHINMMPGFDSVRMPQPQPGPSRLVDIDRPSGTTPANCTGKAEAVSGLQPQPGRATPALPCKYCGQTHISKTTTTADLASTGFIGLSPAMEARRLRQQSYVRGVHMDPSAEIGGRMLPRHLQNHHSDIDRFMHLQERGMPGGWRPYNFDAMAPMGRSPMMFISSDNERTAQSSRNTASLTLMMDKRRVDATIAVHHPSHIDKAKGLGLDRREFAPAEEKLKLGADETKRLIGPVFDCAICLDSQPEGDVAIVQSCGHRFCRDCLKGHVTSCLEDAKFPISCPSCTGGHERSAGVISQELAEDLGMNASQLKRWSDLELAAFSVVLECRQCHRSARVDREEYTQTQVLYCPFRNCNHRWCKACNIQVPLGTTHSCDGQMELQALMRQRGWKPCPGCKTNTEKQTGCNHMTCTAPGCQTHWCYVCGDAIAHATKGRDLAIALDAHYKQGCRMFAPVAVS